MVFWLWVCTVTFMGICPINVDISIVNSVETWSVVVEVSWTEHITILSYLCFTASRAKIKSNPTNTADIIEVTAWKLFFILCPCIFFHFVFWHNMGKESSVRKYYGCCVKPVLKMVKKKAVLYLSHEFILWCYRVFNSPRYAFSS